MRLSAPFVENLGHALGCAWVITLVNGVGGRWAGWRWAALGGGGSMGRETDGRREGKGRRGREGRGEEDGGGGMPGRAEDSALGLMAIVRGEGSYGIADGAGAAGKMENIIGND